MSRSSNQPFERDKVRQRFDKAASSYDQVAVLQREVGNRLLESLRPAQIDPSRILDLGAGTGYVTRSLLKEFRQASVFALDVAPAMLRHNRPRGHWLPWVRKPHCVCADLHSLPFADATFDLVVSNLALQWSDDLPRALAEIRRVTSPQGAVFFSTFGPQTLYELREAWSEVDDYEHVHRFIDKHTVGDLMLAAGFSGPVVSGENITLTYDQPREAMRDLKKLGAANLATNRSRGLTSPHRLARVEAAYSIAHRNQQGRVPATYEVIYGHAWKCPATDCRDQEATCRACS
ncbi:malonyl-ACP O-methyltransferase BioC [Halorhodospira halochloris]|uniref:malonyl-ACP O-methyltransferase BioC n=1 Tax=Halorhodospira halochloris TaxID=1052 RepID=UPI001EE92FB1|nr:malonyl-ACP O-methyltransferase BioC [Halorhodospira halochloris]